MLTALTRIDRYECFAASKEAPDRGAEPGLPVPFGGNLDGEGKPITNIASTPAVPSEQHPVKALVSQCIIPSVRNPLLDAELWARSGNRVMVISYMYSSPLRRRRSFHHIGIAAACVTTLVGLAFIAASVMRLELLEEAHKELFPMALGISLVALGVLSIASYAVVRAIEWASR